jgi:hypothetical protein
MEEKVKKHYQELLLLAERFEAGDPEASKEIQELPFIVAYTSKIQSENEIAIYITLTEKEPHVRITGKWNPEERIMENPVLEAQDSGNNWVEYPEIGDKKTLQTIMDYLF